MMKLGKVINEKSTVGIELFRFDLTDMVWSNLPLTIEFNIAKEPFGKGGFREAFKATSKMPEFHGQQWVVKRYLASAVDIIKQTKQTVEQHKKGGANAHAGQEFCSKTGAGIKTSW